MKFEMRWLIRPGWDGPEKVLQYRENSLQPCYSMVDSSGEFVKIPTWSEWKDVPEVNHVKNSI